MANFNKCFFLGRFVADPQERITPKGRAVATFALAIERRIDKDNVVTTYPEFKAWDNMASTICKYCSKGRSVFIESHVEQQVWQDKQTGKTRSKVWFIVDNFQFNDSKPRQSRTPQQPDEEPQQQQTYTPDEAENDIPF